MVGDVSKLSRTVKRSLRLKELCQNIRDDRQWLQQYRKNYHKIAVLIAGADWSDNASDLRRPLNLTGKYVDILAKSIVNQTPRMMLSTWRHEHARTVWAAQEWGNEQCVKINLGDALFRWVQDALLWMGVMYTGIADPIDSKRKGYGFFAGESFAESISPADWFCDRHAKTWEEVAYEGHRYRGEVDIANQFFNLKGDRKLEASQEQRYEQEGDEKVWNIGRGWSDGNSSEYQERTTFWQVYLPKLGLMLKFRAPSDGAPMGEEDLLSAKEYTGPRGGCYTKLTYSNVPGQLVGKGPAMDLIALDLATNVASRKYIRQMDRCSTVTLYSGRASEDMNRMATAYDGKSILCDHPGEVREFVRGNPNPVLLAGVKAFKDLFSWMGGNLDVIAGLSRQAGTAAQESQMNTNAGASVQQMIRTTVRQTNLVMEKMCWGWWTDPMGVMQAVRKMESNPDETFVQTITPEERGKLDWYEDIKAQVDQYSFTHETPQSKLQHLRSVMQMAVSMMPFLQQQGQSVDAKFYFRKEGELTNNPDIAELCQLLEPVPGESAKGEGPGKPAGQERIYKHVGSGSEKTGGGEDEDMLQQLLAAGQAQSEPQSTEVA